MLTNPLGRFFSMIYTTPHWHRARTTRLHHPHTHIGCGGGVVSIWSCPPLHSASGRVNRPSGRVKECEDGEDESQSMASVTQEPRIAEVAAGRKEQSRRGANATVRHRTAPGGQ